MNKESFTSTPCMKKRDIDTNSLKLEINNMIWEYAPDKTTLKDAEDIAIKIFDLILGGKFYEEANDENMDS